MTKAYAHCIAGLNTTLVMLQQQKHNHSVQTVRPPPPSPYNPLRTWPYQRHTITEISSQPNTKCTKMPHAACNASQWTSTSPPALLQTLVVFNVPGTSWLDSEVATTNVTDLPGTGAVWHIDTAGQYGRTIEPNTRLPFRSFQIHWAISPP